MDTPKALAALAALREIRAAAVETLDVLSVLVKTCHAWEKLVGRDGLMTRNARGGVDVQTYCQEGLIELIDKTIAAETARPWNVFLSLRCVVGVIREVAGHEWAGNHMAHTRTMALYCRSAARGNEWVPVREREPAMEANARVVALWTKMKALTAPLHPRLQELYLEEDTAMLAAGIPRARQAAAYSVGAAK